MIAAYMDYLMNLEENRGDATDNRPIVPAIRLLPYSR